MKGKRFTEEQIIRILHEAKSGLSEADVCRKHNCATVGKLGTNFRTTFGAMILYLTEPRTLGS